MRRDRSLTPGSLASRVVVQLGVCPATVGGLARELQADAAQVGSLLVRLMNRGQVVVYCSIAEAQAKGLKFSASRDPRGFKPKSNVYGLASAELLAKSQRAGRGVAPNSGLTGEIKALLAGSPNLTCCEIAARLGRDVRAVKVMLDQATQRSGGIVARKMPGQRERVYLLFDRSCVARPKREGEHFAHWPTSPRRGFAGWGQWR